jgi:hypothetical protein
MDNVILNIATQCYDVEGEPIGFDEIMYRIGDYASEISGIRMTPLSDLPSPERGTLEAYYTMCILHDELVAAAALEGKDPTSGESPLLVGLEGHAVEVETEDRKMRRFIVERTDEPIPRHMEFNGRSRRQADRDYLQVLDLGEIQ